MKDDLQTLKLNHGGRDSSVWHAVNRQLARPLGWVLLIVGSLVWAAYGIHLYFSRQTLMRKLPNRLNNSAGMAFIIGFEAPFICEVLGNLLFLQLLGEYYAYYLPGDVFHLTSFRVVPIYMLCLFVGLVILGKLENLPRKMVLPPALMSAGVAYLVTG
jgi:hypothetical protein